MPVQISDDLASSIMQHLLEGGTNTQGKALAALFGMQANEPLRQQQQEEQVALRIKAAVDKALAPPPAPEFEPPAEVVQPPSAPEDGPEK